MASAPIWWECVWHIVDALRGAPLMAEVQVEDGNPGEQGRTSDEIVFVADVTSEESRIPVATGGAKSYDDIFTVRLVVDVRGRGSRRACQIRSGEIQGAIHKTLAGDPTLGDIDGVLSAEISSRSQMALGQLDGAVAYGEVSIRIHARITPD